MRPVHPLDYAPEVLGATAVVIGVAFRTWPLVSLGAGALGAPAIFVNGAKPSATTGRTKPMWRTKDERAAAKAERETAEPGDGFQPEADVSVFLPEDGENQTAAREQFVKNVGLEKS